MSAGWSYARAEEHLRSLELFGMRFGLERMHRLMTALDSPQRRFASIHVVGTNGKSSTVRMTAAILQRHGLRTGTYVSPHLTSFTERVQVDGSDIDAFAFAAAVERAARAATLVDRTLEGGERVTQFELLTAAAYDELAEREVDVAVIEAGLGGRYDATNVIPSAVQALTNVGLEHTRWLGPTVLDIAREKLAVVRDSGTLVIGALEPEARAEAVAVAAHRAARLLEAPAAVSSETALAARGTFQRRNFALASTVATAFHGPLNDAAVRDAAAAVTVPGRCEIVASDPLTVLDGAHNPSGMAALVESLPEIGGARRPTPVVAVVSILEDKDAAGMLAELLAACDAAIFTSNASPRALPPATLQSLAGQVGFAGSAEIVADPGRALSLGRERAGRGGMVLATGSIYLVAELARVLPAVDAQAR
ncbi:MAG: Mur ligase family protein [Actinomycetota bacterium]|nr:Mur ligase family protein [Actinomycetota bacterium]